MRAYSILMGIIIAQLMLIAPYQLLVFNQQYYIQQFENTGTYTRVENADTVSKDIMDYLQGKKPSLESQGFTEEEKSHMADVKRVMLYERAYLIFLIALLLLLIAAAIKFKAESLIADAFVLGSIIILSFALIMAVLSGFFPQTFELFHKLFFPQGNYLFPENSLLIRLFHQQFFYNFAYDIILRATILSALCGLAAMYTKKKFLNKAHRFKTG